MMIDPNDTIDVLHPNGSVVTLPTSIAMAAGVTPDMIVPRNQATAPTDNASPAAPGQQPPSSPPQSPTAQPQAPQNLGVYGGTGVDQEVAAPSGATAPAPDATNPNPPGPGAPVAPQPAAPAPGPAAAPLTTGDLQKTGIAGIYNASSAALQKVEDAGKNVADKEAAQQVAFANAYDTRNTQINDLLKKRADDAQAKAKEIDTRIADYDATVKKYADTKIDRGIDHPIVAAISAVLGMFGQAATGSQTNGALDLMFKQVERKAQAQLEDKNALGQVIGMKRADIDLIRQKATDSTARYNLALAGEIEKTARQIEAVGARSQSDIVKARSQEAAAQFRQKGADALGQAVMAQQGKDERDRAFTEQLRHTKVEERNSTAQVGIAGGHLALARKSLDEQIREHDLARQDKLDELALGYAKLGAKDKAERAKEVATTGVFDPTSGQAVLTPDGQKILDQADKLEIAARKAPPAQQAQMIAQAKNLRDQAEAVGGFTIGDKDIRKDVIKKVGASQDMINTIDDIKATLASDPSSIDRTTWAALETKYEQAKAAFIEAHGAKMSSREMEAVHEMFGSSPADMTTRLGGRGKMLARLDALEHGAIGGTTTELHANGYKGSWTPRHVGGDAPEVLGGATSLERAADAQKGALGSVLPDSDLKFRSNDARSRQAENSGPITPTGLSPQDTNVVQQLARKYDNANNSDRDKIKSQLQAYASSGRPGLAQAVVTLVNAENPGLYKEIVASTPGAPRVSGEGTPLQPVFDRVAQQQVLASAPIMNLRDAALAGDEPSKVEIVRRASGGDKSAMAAVADLVKAKQ